MALLTTSEAAQELGLDPCTIRKRIHRVSSAQRTELGHWLIPDSALNELRAKNARDDSKKRRPSLLSGPAERALVLLGDWKQGTSEELAAATGVVPANARKALAIAHGQGLAIRIEGSNVWTLTDAGHKWLANRSKEDAA